MFPYCIPIFTHQAIQTAAYHPLRTLPAWHVWHTALLRRESQSVAGVPTPWKVTTRCGSQASFGAINHFLTGKTEWITPIEFIGCTWAIWCVYIIYIYMYIYAYVCVYIHNMYANIDICICIIMCIYIHIYIYEWRTKVFVPCNCHGRNWVVPYRLWRFSLFDNIQ